MIGSNLDWNQFYSSI